jgi:hypothetical protein
MENNYSGRKIMSKSKRQKLQDNFPIFYGSLRYGFECGVGWYEPLKELGEKVEPILEKEDAEPLSETVYEFDDREVCERLIVKEKFGELRIQYPSKFDVSDKALEKIKEHIEEARQKCTNTCETCGSTEDVKRDRYNPICEECKESDNNVRFESSWEE